MRRIYLIWFCRLLTRPLALRLALLLIGVLISAALVSLPNVLKNALSSSSGYAFLWSAYGQTALTVKGLAAALGLLAVWILWDCLTFAKRLVGAHRRFNFFH